jgi:hypothetical protein
MASLRLSPAREAEIIDEFSQHLDDHWRDDSNRVRHAKCPSWIRTAGPGTDVSRRHPGGTDRRVIRRLCVFIGESKRCEGSQIR